MTVKEYLESFRSANLTTATPGDPSFMEAIQDAAEIWSNNAYRGYFLWAARAVGLSSQQIRVMLKAYGEAFETMLCEIFLFSNLYLVNMLLSPNTQALRYIEPIEPFLLSH